MTILPNLLVIGAMKAGTTSFHEMLNQHPDIFMSEVKEINFFSDNILWEKGLEWYQSHFMPGAQCKIKGESSVNYSKQHRFSNVPVRISSVLAGDVKFIYLLRDPIDRFCSNFTDSKTYGDIPPDLSFNHFVCDHDIKKNPIALTGNYYSQVSAFLEFFERDHILLIEFERLIRDTSITMDKVCNFLEVKPWSFSLNNDNKSESKEYEGEMAIKLKRIKGMIPQKWRSHLLNMRFIKKALKTKVDHHLNRPDQYTEDLLHQFYSGEIKNLQESFGFYPKHWRKYN